MKEDFLSYIKSIGLTTEVMHERIVYFHDLHKKICPDEIVDIFISDYINADGGRRYQDLWFFSEKYCMDAKEFAWKDELAITPSQHVDHCEIRMQHYSFEQVTERSRLQVAFTLSLSANCNLGASMENCDFLWNIMLKHIIPNLRA